MICICLDYVTYKKNLKSSITALAAQMILKKKPLNE